MDDKPSNDARLTGVFYLLLAFVYIYGLFIPLMDNDSAHHATIALNMHRTGNYAFLIDLGLPYLDKPHLLFWLAAATYKLLGVTTLAYKLPSFLFSLLAIYSTYRLGTLLYSRAVGKLSALVLSTSCAFMLANNDVRMEALLTGSIILSIWQLCEYVQTKRTSALVIAALGLALGFSTKGLIGVVIPAVTLFVHLLYTRNRKMIFHVKWLLLILLFALFISPVVYSYYLQYDLHPETVVRGKSGISGVKFILWSQNLDRMSGASHGKLSQDPLFFFHSLLWAFLPWSLLAYASMASRLKRLVKTRAKSLPGTEMITAGGVIFFLIFFSFSNFKLPHYLNCLFPLLSILVAAYMYEQKENIKALKTIAWVQFVSVTLLVLVAVELNGYAFPVKHAWVLLLLLVLTGVFIFTAVLKQPLFSKYISFTLSGAILIYASLNINFYPQLLTYQAGNELAFKSSSQKINPASVYFYLQEDYSFSYDFYTAYIHTDISLDEIKEKRAAGKPVWVYTTQKGHDTLTKNNIRLGKIYSNNDYRVSRLKPAFVNPQTRQSTLTTTYLIQIR